MKFQNDCTDEREVSDMPWWGWFLIGLAVVIGLPIKLKVLKNMAAKRAERQKMIDEEM